MATAVAAEFNYRRGDIVMIPFNLTTGVFNEDSLIAFYDRLKQEDLWDIVFHENPGMSMREFLNFFSVPSNLLYVFTIAEGDEMVDVAGLAWLADIISCQGIWTRALGSFVFFRKYQSPQYTDECCKIILDFWFNFLGVNMIVGATPEENRLALLYIKRAGFREVARIPSYTTLRGKIMDGVITTMTKQQYLSTITVGGNNGQGSG